MPTGHEATLIFYFQFIGPHSLQSLQSLQSPLLNFLSTNPYYHILGLRVSEPDLLFLVSCPQINDLLRFLLSQCWGT